MGRLVWISRSRVFDALASSDTPRHHNNIYHQVNWYTKIKFEGGSATSRTQLGSGRRPFSLPLPGTHKPDSGLGIRLKWCPGAEGRRLTSRVYVRTPGKGDFNSHGARPVHLCLKNCECERTRADLQLEARERELGAAAVGALGARHDARGPHCLDPRWVPAGGE